MVWVTPSSIGVQDKATTFALPVDFWVALHAHGGKAGQIHISGWDDGLKCRSLAALAFSCTLAQPPGISLMVWLDGVQNICVSWPPLFIVVNIQVYKRWLSLVQQEIKSQRLKEKLGNIHTPQSNTHADSLVQAQKDGIYQIVIGMLNLQPGLVGQTM